MPDTDIEIDLIRAFIAVAQCGSFTAAADVINRSQSAVSQKIIRLEQLLGYPVFERTSRSLMLTEKGKELLVASRRLLTHYSDFLTALTTRSPLPRLRLGVSENLVPTLLPRVLARFANRHPEVELDLTTGLSHQLLEEEKAGHLDLVVSKRTQGGQGAGQVIWREPLVWIAAAHYKVAALEPLRLVTMRPPCGYRDLLSEALASVKRDWICTCQANNLMSLQAAVLGGLGITALGRSFLQPGLRVVGKEEGLPALPVTEVVVTGDAPALHELKQCLIMMLSDELSAIGRLTDDVQAAVAP